MRFVRIILLMVFFLVSCASTQPKQDESKDAKFYNNRGAAYGEKGQYDQAIMDFNQAIEMNPRYIRAYNNRGVIYRLKGQYDRAISDFNKAIEMNSLDPEAYNNLAWLFATAKAPAFRDGRRAVELALRACELSDWKIGEYLDTLAAAYARRGDFDYAVKWQEKALEHSKSARPPEFQERLNLYRERKAWPPE
jgi:Tfp pilus assembly protein PilF